MQIHLKEADLKTAVKDFIAKMGVTRPVGNIDFTATRGADGVLTTVELSIDGPDTNVVTIGSLISEQLVSDQGLEVASERALDLAEPSQGFVTKTEDPDDISANSLFS